MRKTRFAPGNYYHIYNRGQNKQQIFLNARDYMRFLFLLLHMQGKAPLVHTTRLLKSVKSIDEIKLDSDTYNKIIQTKIIELVQYALMPNHFHLLVYETEEGGISRYMQRLQNSYTKFFNTKYDRTGHLFQGPFGAAPVKNGEQLLYLSAYIHANPLDIKEFRDMPEKYPWSSYQDFTTKNRWPDLLKPGIILDQFRDSNDYLNFVKKSGAKSSSFDFKTGRHDGFIV